MHPSDMVQFVPEKEGILIKPVMIVDRDDQLNEDDIFNIEKLMNSQVETGKYVKFNTNKRAIDFLKKKIKK